MSDGITCPRCRRVWGVHVTRCPLDGRVLRPNTPVIPRDYPTFAAIRGERRRVTRDAGPQGQRRRKTDREVLA